MGGFGAFLPLLLIIVVFYLFLIRPQLKNRKKHYDKLPRDERDLRLIYQYFEPERRFLQMQNRSGISGGDVAGGVTNAMFKGTGLIFKMIPGMGWAGSVMDGAGNLASKGIKAGGNALSNDPKNAELQRLRSGNVNRIVSDAEFDELVKSRVLDSKKIKQTQLYLTK